MGQGCRPTRLAISPLPIACWRARASSICSGAPFILWPPLYPLVLAGLSLITRWNTFQSAWYLNVALYALNIWLSGWLLYRIFRDKPFYAAAAALIILLSRSTLRIYANVASEPLFATFMLLFFFAAARYLEGASRRALWLMFVLAGLATLQRYLGVALFGVAALAVFYKERWRGILRAASACPPIRRADRGLGPRSQPAGQRHALRPARSGAMLPLENISLSLTKILWWFIPRLALTDPLLLHPWIVVLAIVVLLVIVNKRTDWAGWLRSLAGAYLWPALLFSAVYFFLLAFTVVTADHLDLTSDRYYVVILPAVVALGFVTLDKLVLVHLRTGSPFVRYALPALLMLWLIYPVYSLQAYVREALVRGEPTNYNIANSAGFRELGVVKAAHAILEKDPSAPIYSNYVNIVWFIFRHPVRILPYEDATLSRAERLVALPRNYPGWPRERGYIIWFTPNQYHHIVAPDELLTIADLKLLYKDKTGEIYLVDSGK